MKKIIFLAMVLSVFTATAFSHTPDYINQKVLNNFNNTYTSAANIQWTMAGEWMKATFTFDGQRMYAYYRDNGDLVAVTRNLAVSQLPIALAAELKAKYEGQWLTNLFEVSADGETSYFASLNSADHVTVLKAGPSGNWSVFSKTRNTSR